jgi:PhnB protein
VSQARQKDIHLNPLSDSGAVVGGSPVTVYLLTENADKIVAKAVKLGGTAQGPVTDMFWGDRCGTVIDPDGYSWMVATHIADLTPQEMNKKMKAQMGGQTAAASGA